MRMTGEDGWAAMTVGRTDGVRDAGPAAGAAPGETTLRIVVADDDHLLRSALAQILDLREGFQVVGQAADGLEAVDVIRACTPDLAVVDLDMPGLDGIAVAERLREAPTRVVIVTRHARPAHLRRALGAGAAGFIIKSTSSQRLAEILRDVAQGQRYVDPEVAASALTMRECPLTEREREVLALIHQGHRTAEVAQALHLAAGTVRNYVSSALTRLGADSGREAAAIAHTEGWI